MKEPTQEQIKELWEWCRVSLKHDWDNEYLGYKTNGSFCTRCGHTEGYVPDTSPCLLPIDLNNLFKYAVPKLEEHSAPAVEYVMGVFCEAVYQHKDPALVLFWVIREVIYKGGADGNTTKREA